MGMMDKFRSFMGMPDDDDYDDDYDYEKESETDYASNKRAAKEAPMAENPYASEPEVVKRSNKVVNIAATTQLSVVLVKPERFDDASSIADHLNDKRTVVLNLESTNKDVSRRLVDFLSGVAYANRGQIKRVANSTFIITPYNVDFVGDLLDELENSGVYF
ncbi:MAG: cell division protein SepF [Candidatus Fimivivens sp.]|nr:cell division protein SepF [Candidatus Fimivivens sp.]